MAPVPEFSSQHPHLSATTTSNSNFKEFNLIFWTPQAPSSPHIHTYRNTQTHHIYEKHVSLLNDKEKPSLGMLS